MNPAYFPQANFTLGGNNKDVQDLPCHFDGHTFTSVWELSDEEVEILIKTRALFLQVWGMTYEDPKTGKRKTSAPPILPSVYNLLPQNPYIYHRIWYRRDGQLGGIYVYVAEDVPVPEKIMVPGGKEGRELHIAEMAKVEFRPGREIQPGEFFFVKPSQGHIDARVSDINSEPHENWEELVEMAKVLPVLCRKQILAGGIDVYS